MKRRLVSNYLFGRLQGLDVGNHKLSALLLASLTSHRQFPKLCFTPTSWTNLAMLDFDDLAIIGVVLVVVLSSSYTSFHGQRREPPSVSSTIPFVGHLIGLIQHGSGYLSMLWWVIDHIICTVWINPTYSTAKNIAINQYSGLIYFPSGSFWLHHLPSCVLLKNTQRPLRWNR